MKNLLFPEIFSLLLLMSCTSGTETFVVNFEGKMSEKKWAIRELNKELPSDWSSFSFLTFELKSSTTQRFDLRIYDTAGVRRLTIQSFSGCHGFVHQFLWFIFRRGTQKEWIWLQLVKQHVPVTGLASQTPSDQSTGLIR